jgi:SAM-dependent methyltransferase
MPAQDPDSPAAGVRIDSPDIAHLGVSVTSAVGDYFLGTRDAEVARLGLQHRVWREHMLGAWRRAGLRSGWRVVDVGAGPGYAAMDLAEAVGANGEVLAVDRSPRFVSLIAATARERGLAQIRALEMELMAAAALEGCDMAWCRWVASFTPSVPTLVAWIRRALRVGGVAVFHEYADYGSWRVAPARPRLTEFVREVMASWRAAGGEPDVAPALIAALRAEGFRLKSVRPLVFATNPAEVTWQWPAAFVASAAARLHELGRVSSEWVDEVGSELRLSEADPASVMVTPMVLEVIAVREDAG